MVMYDNECGHSKGTKAKLISCADTRDFLTLFGIALKCFSFDMFLRPIWLSLVCTQFLHLIDIHIAVI